MDSQPVFYYDLGSPQCYIVGETIMSTLPVVPEWEPVLASQLVPGSEQQANTDRSEIERLADELGLQSIRWPTPWPPDTGTAMLAATYAKKVGRGVAFSLAAFRQTFAGGRDIGDETTVLIAGAACEMHPTALRKGIELRSTADALETANARARAAGVTILPAIEMDGRVYEGAAAMTLAGAGGAGAAARTREAGAP